MQFLTKVDDMPVVVQRQVSTAQTVQKAMEVPPLQFTDKVSDIPVVAQRQIPIVVQTIQKTTDIPQLQCIHKVIDVPVVSVAQAPHVQIVEKTVESSQMQIAEKTSEISLLQIVKKTVETPEVQTVRCTQTSESLGNAPVCRSTQAEIVEAVEIEVPLPAESASPMSVTEPVLEVPPIVGKIDEIPEIRTDVGTQTSESVGTALVEDTEASVLKTPDSIKAHDQASLKTTRNPNGESYPAFASEKSWNEASGKTVAHRQVPLVQKIQKMVEVPQIQYIDKVVDGPVEMQPAPEMELVTSTLATEYIALATGVIDSVATDSSLRKRKSSGSLQSPRVKAGTRTQVQDDDIRHEVFHVNIASADEMEEAASVYELASKCTPSELDDVKSGMEHVKKDLKEARKMLEFLVRRERKVDTRAEVATRRLERLERERRTMKRIGNTGPVWRKPSWTRPKS